MNKKAEYTDEPLDFTVIPDFLPPPQELARRRRTRKVTIEVDEPTVALFRSQAGKSSLTYQKLMSRLLDLYATRYSLRTPATPRPHRRTP